MRDREQGDYGEIVRCPVDTCWDAFKLGRHRIVCLVGAGGKTSLMFAMARELGVLGKHVITSTTTKIFEPSHKDTPFLILTEATGDSLETVPGLIHRYGHLTFAEKRLPNKKLKGVSPELIDVLGALDAVDHIIVEADGAARLPLKAPGENEPVITSQTSLMVPVVGIDGIGLELSEDHVFRPHVFSKLTGLPLGEKVTVEAIADLMVHPRGMLKGAPLHSSIIPFLNKVDMLDGLEKGWTLARRILEKDHPKINRVVLGHAAQEKPVVEVICRR